MENRERKGRNKKVRNELSLARREGEGEGMLLAKGRPRLPIYSSSGRDKRQNTATDNKEAKGGKTKNPSPASSIGAKAQDSYADSSIRPKRRGHRRYDKDRQPDNGAKGTHNHSRRSAQELGIEWIGSFCPDGKPHNLIGIHNFDGGSVFKCANCHQSIWIPIMLDLARKLDSMIDKLGVQVGYCKFLDSHRPAKIMMAKLQDLWRAKQEQSTNGDFLLLVLDTMKDSDYDRA